MTDEASEIERRLAATARAGDRVAFDRLITLHKGSLYRFLRRYVGNPDDAYDLLQDTFVSAWLALKRYDPQRSFSTWLCAIALNKCRDFARRAAVRRRILALLATETRAEAIVASGESVEGSQRERSNRLRQLDAAIARLPRRYREPLLLTLVTGLTQEQAARQLDTSVKAIELRIRRAKERLRELLIDE